MCVQPAHYRMPVPGYDPEDLERWLDGEIGDELDQYLTDDERRRYAQGDDLIDLLDAEDIERLLDRRS